MKNVFVSRPTWVDPKFQKGLDGFLRVLAGLDLQPRTIGTTDYPSKAPLNEVIKLMELCSGAIILGYPQIVATAGYVKDKPISTDVILPTEWNHIEAGLAHARGIPLLVIHHHGISRGIFDRGAIANFIYELDLADPAWPLRPEVQGAIANWKNDVLTGIPASGGSVVTAKSIGRGAADAPMANRPTHYCKNCGTVPGGSTKCMPGYRHDFVAMSVNVFCRNCGATPGKSTPCNPGYRHNFSPA
jgi:hypothetical protein